MRVWVRPILILLFLVLIPMPAWSIIIETTDGKTIRGHFIEKQPLHVVLRVDGSNEKIRVENNKIKKLIQVVKTSRLGELDPKKPGEYFVYATELSGQAEDPEARDMAIRLFLISAHLQPERHGAAALTAASRLARSQQEERALRVLAHFYQSDKAFEPPKTSAKVDETDPTVREQFIKALSLLRRGETEEALKVAKTPQIKELFAATPRLMTFAEFEQMCRKHPMCSCKTGRIFCGHCAGKGRFDCRECAGKGWTLCQKCQGNPKQVPLTPTQRNTILQLELLHLENPQQKLTQMKQEKSDWSLLIGNGNTTPISVLKLQEITEFDPRQCLFRGGEWIAP